MPFSLNQEIVISVVALIISFYAVLVLKKQLRILKWNQIDKTFHYMEMWGGEHITNVRIKARKYFDYEGGKPIEIEKLTKLPNYEEVSTLFTTILNFLEMLSIAILKNVVDEEITYHDFVYIVVRHYTIFKPYINHLRKQFAMTETPSLRIYGHLEIVAERWIAQMEKESETIKDRALDLRYRKIEKKPIYEEKD